MAEQRPLVVLYAAKSTLDPHGSIPEQLTDGRQLAAARGFDVVAEYQDEAASAYHGDRGPGLASALQECEQLSAQGSSCVLIVQHSDRLARGDAKQARHLIEVVLWAIKNDVQLLSCQDPEMLAGGDMALLLGAIGGMRNHQDSKRKALAVTAGVRRRAERGQWAGGPRPLGYLWERYFDDQKRPQGRLVPVAAEVPVVQRIYREYLAGSPQRTIARALNVDGVPTVAGGSWYQATVRLVLSNPIYKGAVRLNGTIYPGHHEAIIDPKVWDQVCGLREAVSESRGKGRGRTPRGSHLFTNGLLRCGLCGGPMSTVTKPTRTPGKTYEIYQCFKRLSNGPDACPQPIVRRETIDSAVWTFFERVALDAAATREAITQHADHKLAEHEALRGQAQQELARVEAAKDRIERDYVDEKITAEQWARLEAKLTDQITAARAQVEQHDRQRNAIVASVADFDAEAAMLEELTAIRTQIAGEVQAGSREGLESFRAALRRLFVSFELVSPAKPFGTGRHDETVWIWTPQTESEVLTVGNGYVIEPQIRNEAVDLSVDAEPGAGWPALRRVALALGGNKHDSLQT
jgi:DNA invertase Pin-like site-specific DNA recombinase